MSTDTIKFIVKQVEKGEEGTKYHFIGTVMVRDDGTGGVIKTSAYGDLQLYRKKEEGKELNGKNGEALYTVKKAKKLRDGKAVHNEVGTFLVRTNGTPRCALPPPDGRRVRRLQEGGEAGPGRPHPRGLRPSLESHPAGPTQSHGVGLGRRAAG